MRVRTLMPWVLGQTLLFFSASTEADDALGDWRKALRLFKQKQYDAACPLFEAAAKAKKTHGAIWADLGLCELRRGETDASVRASELAVRFGTDKVRSAAYFNLHLAEHALSLPESGCAMVASSPGLGCATSAAVCVSYWENFGSGQSTSGTAAYFADTVEHAQAFAEEIRPATYRNDIRVGIALSEEQRCHSWCAKHPEVDCVDTCEEGMLLSCTVVSIDACNKRVGYVCSSWDEAGKPPQVAASEAAFPEDP